MFECNERKLGERMNKYIEYAISKYTYFTRRSSYRESDKKGIIVTCFVPIGDSVLLTPIVKQLRCSFPKHKIVIITNPICYNIWELCPYADAVLVYDDKVTKHYYLTNRERCINFVKEYLDDGVDYEYGFAPSYFMPNLRSAWLLYFAGVRNRIAFTEDFSPKDKAQLMGTHDIYFTHLLTDNTLKHDVEKNLDLLRLMNISVTDNSLELWNNSNDEIKVKELFQSEGIEPERIKIVTILSTSIKSKNWPIDRYIAVAKAIHEIYPVQFLLFGAGDIARCYAEKFLNEVPNTYDFTNKTSLRETYVAMTMSDCYFGGDTGPMHMATVAGLPGVAIYKVAEDMLFAPQDFGNRLYPWQSDIVMIRPQKALPGCECGCLRDEAHCIKQIDVSEVKNALEKVVGKKAKSVFRDKGDW